MADFQIEKLVYVQAWDVTAIVGYWEQFQAPFVVFRGTDSHNMRNWIQDMEILKAPYLRMPMDGAASAFNYMTGSHDNC